VESAGLWYELKIDGDSDGVTVGSCTDILESRNAAVESCIPRGCARDEADLCRRTPTTITPYRGERCVGVQVVVQIVGAGRLHLALRKTSRAAGAYRNGDGQWGVRVLRWHIAGNVD